MEMRKKEMVCICGLYCGTCPHYLSPRLEDRAEMEKMSRQNGLPVEEQGCDGCLSEHLFEPCRECKHGFRTCAREHNVTWCFECPEFPCQRLEDFRPIHVVNDISHHERILEELRSMKGEGIDAWLKRKDEESRCPACGKPAYWYSRTCPSCGAGVR
jgi:hypothetical protein